MDVTITYKKILDLLKYSKLYKETGESVQREDGYGRKNNINKMEGGGGNDEDGCNKS